MNDPVAYSTQTAEMIQYAYTRSSACIGGVACRTSPPLLEDLLCQYLDPKLKRSYENPAFSIGRLHWIVWICISLALWVLC